MTGVFERPSADDAPGEAPVVVVEEGSVGRVATKSLTFDEPVVLDEGARLAPVTVAYETYGELNAAADNAILVEHALTASAHVAGRHDPSDRAPGWWDVMIGRGRALDTTKYFVVCSNLLGSCYGTTGPSSVNPDTGKTTGQLYAYEYITTFKDDKSVYTGLDYHDKIFYGPAVAISNGLLHEFEEPVVLQTGPDIAEATFETGGLVRRLQTGLLRTYVLFLAAGAAAVVLAFLIAR